MYTFLQPEHPVTNVNYTETDHRDLPVDFHVRCI